MAENEDVKVFATKLDELAKTIQTGFQAVDKKVDEVKKKSETLETKLDEAKKTDDEEDEDELDELSGPEEIAQKLEKRVDEKLSALELQNRRDQEFRNLCEVKDREAFRKYPDLHDESSEFSRLVRDQLNDPKKTFPIGKDRQGKAILSPDAVLNAANAVATDNPKFLTQQKFEELEGGGNFQRRIKGKEMSEVTKEIAAMFSGSYKINMDRLRERVKAGSNVMRK